MMSVIPLAVPSTTPVWSEVKSSGQAMGVGEAPSAFTSSCGRSATTVRSLSPSRSPGPSTRRSVLAKERQPPVFPMVISRIASPESARMRPRISPVICPSVSTSSAMRSSLIR